MAIIKKYSPFLNLSNYETYLLDDQPLSEFFRITEFKETFTGGKNGFLIEGSAHLRETTELKIEILDVNGDTIYFEPGYGIPEYYEGTSTLVSVHVYDDTPIGIAKITILAEAKTYEDPEKGTIPVPDNWKNVYNVKWQKEFKVNKLLLNEDKVRFYKRPDIIIDEIVKPLFGITTPVITQTGSVVGIPQTPDEGTEMKNWSAGTLYLLKTTDGSYWTSSIDENIVSIPSLDFYPTVKEVINERNVLVDIPYTENGIVKGFDSASYTATFEYIEGQTLSNSALEGSFANIKMTRLKTFVGDVARVKIYRKSRNEVGDYQLTQDIKLESTELLKDVEIQTTTEVDYGRLTEENIVNYWVSSSSDHPISLNVDKLQNSMFIDYDSVAGGTQKIETKLDLGISKDVEYTLEMKVLFSGSIDDTKQIKAYISSSNFEQEIITIKSSGELLVRKNINENIIASTTDEAKLVFDVTGDDWYISEISLRNAQETSFSPDEFSMIQSVPRKLNVETFDFKFEFYDINNNYIPVDVYESKIFDGGNLTDESEGDPFILFDSDKTAFRFYTGSYGNPPFQQVGFSVVKNNITGSIVYSSGAYDESGNLLTNGDFPSGYPGTLTNPSDNGATLLIADFTGSNDAITVASITYTASIQGGNSQYETIYRFEDGESAAGLISTSDRNQFYYKITDLVLNPPNQSINFLAKRLNLASLTSPIEVNSGSGAPPLTEISDIDGVKKYQILGDDFDYIVGESTYSFTGSDEYGYKYSDEVTVSPLLSTDGISVDVSVVAAVFKSDAAGNVDSAEYDKADGTVKFTVGLDDIIHQNGLANNRFDIISASGTNCTPNEVSPSTANYGISAMSEDSATMDLLIRYQAGDASTIDFTKTINYSKALEGSGSAGVDARAVKLDTPFYTITYDGEGNTPTPSGTFFVTASAQNYNVPLYKFTGDGIDDDTVYDGTNSQEFTIPTNYFSTPMRVRVGVADNSQNELSYDSISIFAVRPGQSGSDANAVKLTAPSYAISYDKDGLNPNPSGTILVRAESQYFDVPWFRFTGDGVIDDGTFSGNGGSMWKEKAFTIPTTFFTTPMNVRVGASEQNQIELANDIISIYAVKSGTDGSSTEFWYLKPKNGTQIKNSTGSLELQAMYVSGSTTTEITSGTITIHDDSGELTVTTGITAGVNGVKYNPILDQDAILGEKTLYLKDGAEIVDSVTLMDITDGIPAGTVIANNLFTRRAPSSSVYLPTPLAVTSSFYGVQGHEHNEYVTLTPSYSLDENLDYLKYNIDSSNADIEVSVNDGDDYIMTENVYWATKDLNILFTFLDPISTNTLTAQETFYIISDGQDGADSFTIFITNESHTYPADENGVVADGDEPDGAFETRVFKGIQQYTYAGSGEDTYTITNVTEIGITGSFAVNSGQAKYTPTEINTAIDSGTVTFTVVDNETLLEFDKTYSWSKSKAGVDGFGSTFYLIKSLTGTQIKNSEGTLEIQAVEISGSDNTDLDSGNVKLYNGSNVLVDSMTGVSNGGNGTAYNAIFTKDAILGSVVISLKNAALEVLDTITLVDVGDGIPAGSIIANNLFTRRDSGSAVYAPNPLSVTASFYDSKGTEYVEWIEVSASYSDPVDYWEYDVTAGNPNITVVANDGDGADISMNVRAATKDINTLFTFTDPNTGDQMTAQETFYIISDGYDGIPGEDGYTVFFTNAAHTFPADNDAGHSVTAGDLLFGATEIRVFRGTQKLDYALSGTDTYEVQSTTSDGIVMSFSDTGTDAKYTPTSVSQDSGTFDITIQDNDTGTTLDITYSFSKSIRGVDGTGAEFYIITPVNGTIIKNSTGTLELQAQQVSGSEVQDLVTPNSVSLFVGTTPVTSISGVTGTVWNPTFDNTAILGSTIVTLKDGSAGIPLDTITLIDVGDGLAAGTVTANNLFTRRQSNQTTYTPTPLAVTASFYNALGTEYIGLVTVTPEFDTGGNGLDNFYYTVEADGGTNISLEANDGDGTIFSSEGTRLPTKDINLVFTFTDPISSEETIAQETLYIISDGVDGLEGEPGLDGVTISVTPQNQTILHTPPSTYESPESFTVTVREGTASYTYSTSNADSTFKIINLSNGTNSSGTITPTAITSTAGRTITFDVVFVTSNGSSKTVGESHKISVASDGAAGIDGINGSSGSDAKTVSITADKYVVTYNQDGVETPAGQTITLTATEQNHDGTVYYDFTKDGVTKQNTATATYTLPDGEEPLGGVTNLWQVESRENSNSSAVIAFDNIDIFGIQDATDGIDGINTYSAKLTADTYVATYNEAGGESPAGQIVHFTTTTQNISGAWYKYIGSTSGILQNTQTATYSLSITNTIPGPNSQELVTVEVSTTQNGTVVATDSVSIAGIQDGTDGVVGKDAFTIICTNESHTLPTNNSGAVIYTGSGTTFIVYKGITQLQGTVSTPGNGQFRIVAGTDTNITKSSTYGSVSGTNVIFGNHNSMTADAASINYSVQLEGTATVVEKLQSFAKSKEGDNGIDSYTVFLTNEAHTFPASDTGVIGTYTNSQTDIRVFKGTTQIFLDTGSPTYSTSVTPDSGTWTMGASIVGNNRRYTPAGIDNTDNNGTAAITITVDGLTYDKIYSWGKSKEGSDGATGGTGDAGKQTANGMVHYAITAASAPSSPNDGTTSYNFSTGVMSGMRTNWQMGAPTYASGNTNKYWYATFSSEENVAGGGVSTNANNSFGSVTQAIGFSGLVSFTAANDISDDGGNELTFGVAGTTLINGDNISTGKIISTNYVAGTAPYTTTGTQFDLDNGSLYSENFGITTAGDAYFKGTMTIGGTDLTTTNTLNANTTKANVGLGSVSNITTAAMRDGTTKANVGLSSVENRNAQGQATYGLEAGTTINSGGIILSGGGSIHSLNKDSIADTTKGFFLGWDGGSNYDFGIGDGTNYLKWDGSAATLLIKGTLTIGGTSTTLTESNTLNENTTKANVGLGSVSNITTAAMRDGTTAANVGLGSVSNITTAAMRDGTTKANVGLSSVENKTPSQQATAGMETGVNLSGGGITLGTNSSLKTDGYSSTNTEGIFLGSDGISSYDFFVGNATNNMKWDGSAGTLEIKGSISADEGYIGSFDLLDDGTLRSDDEKLILDANIPEIRMYSGSVDLEKTVAISAIDTLSDPDTTTINLTGGVTSLTKGSNPNSPSSNISTTENESADSGYNSGAVQTLQPGSYDFDTSGITFDYPSFAVNTGMTIDTITSVNSPGGTLTAADEFLHLKDEFSRTWFKMSLSLRLVRSTDNTVVSSALVASYEKNGDTDEKSWLVMDDGNGTSYSWYNTYDGTNTGGSGKVTNNSSVSLSCSEETTYKFKWSLSFSYKSGDKSDAHFETSPNRIVIDSPILEIWNPGTVGFNNLPSSFTLSIPSSVTEINNGGIQVLSSLANYVRMERNKDADHNSNLLYCKGGNIATDGDLIANASSDIRLKDNRKVIENPMEKIKTLQGIEFTWNEKIGEYREGKTEYGLIAQELEKVLPFAVANRDNGYKAIHYDNVFALVIEGMKEQQKKIEELEEEIKKLKNK